MAIQDDQGKRLGHSYTVEITMVSGAAEGMSPLDFAAESKIMSSPGSRIGAKHRIASGSLGMNQAEKRAMMDMEGGDTWTMPF